MADFMYLLETRLSPAQRATIATLREAAADQGFNLFLVGGAVRDLTGGSPVRDLDFAVQGDALLLEPALAQAGAKIIGVQKNFQRVAFTMPGGVRAEVGSTLSADYTKLGAPLFAPALLADDLRRRDFTANAMAVSLNEGSFGLLIDPLNGVADIENRELRLVSNYGFLEEPVRLVRATRFMARLGWTLEEKTRLRYDRAVAEESIKNLDAYHRGYELEEIVHEEDPLRVLGRLAEESWLKILAPTWSVSQADSEGLRRLRDLQIQLAGQGIYADTGAVAFPLVTAKMRQADRDALKAQFPHPAFIEEIDALGSDARELTALLLLKSNHLPSAAWKILHSARPETVLELFFHPATPILQGRLRAFLEESPQAREKIPYALMQEMRIVPGVEGYDDLVERLFYALMDGQLASVEEQRMFLEPYSPPAPDPIATIRSTRTTARKEGKSGKGRSRKLKRESEPEHSAGESRMPVQSTQEPQEIAEPDESSAEGSVFDPEVVMTEGANQKSHQEGTVRVASSADKAADTAASSFLRQATDTSGSPSQKKTRMAAKSVSVGENDAREANEKASTAPSNLAKLRKRDQKPAPLTAKLTTRPAKTAPTVQPRNSKATKASQNQDSSVTKNTSKKQVTRNTILGGDADSFGSPAGAKEGGTADPARHSSVTKGTSESQPSRAIPVKSTSKAKKSSSQGNSAKPAGKPTRATNSSV